MQHGPAVRRLQELGDSIGCDTGPNDGIFGKDTQEAVFQVQKKLGILQDGICGPVTWRSLLEYIDNSSGETLDRYFVDLRGAHPPPKNYGRKRKLKEITGVTLHQTGCEMPSNPRGWSRLNAHIGITQEGKLILVNKFTDMIWHAQGLSKTTIGIEFEGNFHGVRGRTNTLWRGGGGPHYFNIAMHMAANKLFDYLARWFAERKLHWNFIHAHRQSSATRRGDPGSEIWKGVAMAWADRLGMTEMDGGEGWHLKEGRGVPGVWKNGQYSTKY